jgi:hypothetical protein
MCVVDLYHGLKECAVLFSGIVINLPSQNVMVCCGGRSNLA